MILIDMMNLDGIATPPDTRASSEELDHCFMSGIDEQMLQELISKLKALHIEKETIQRIVLHAAQMIRRLVRRNNQTPGRCATPLTEEEVNFMLQHPTPDYDKAEAMQYHTPYSGPQRSIWKD